MRVEGRHLASAVDVQGTLVDICAGELVEALGALDVDPVDVDVAAHGRAGADEAADAGVVLLARDAGHVVDVDVGDGQVGRVLVAEGEVALAVALRDFDCVRALLAKRKGLGLGLGCLFHAEFGGVAA